MPPTSPLLDWFSWGSTMGSPVASTIAEQPQATEVSSKKHAACDECRMHFVDNPRILTLQLIMNTGGRKLKCSGDSPQCSRCHSHDLVCHYSFQKPMGRPKKRRRSNLGEDQEVPDNDPDLLNGVPDPWNLIGDTVNLSNDYGDTTLGPISDGSALHDFVPPGNEEISAQAPRQIADIDFSDWQPPDFSNPTFLR